MMASIETDEGRTFSEFLGTMVRWARPAVLVPPRHNDKSIVEDCEGERNVHWCGSQTVHFPQALTNCRLSSSSTCRASTFHLETLSINVLVTDDEWGIGYSRPGSK